MALRGNLRDFTITQLLNLINLAGKTGTLIVDGSADQAHVAFQNGKLAFARIGKEDNRLATVLHRAKILSVNQYRVLAERAGEMTDKELGLLLINAGYVTQEDILVTCKSILQRSFGACTPGWKAPSGLKLRYFLQMTASMFDWTWKI